MSDSKGRSITRRPNNVKSSNKDEHSRNQQANTGAWHNAKLKTTKKKDRHDPKKRQETKMIYTNSATYEGKCTELCFVLGLRVERFNKKHRYHQFSKNAYYHIVLNFKDGGYLHPLCFDLLHLLDVLSIKHKSNKSELIEDYKSVEEFDMDIYK